MQMVKEARIKLEQESVVLSPLEADPKRLIQLARGIFSKGYSDVELIGKIGDAQICYGELIDAGDATSFTELSDEVKSDLLNADYLIEDGVISESATLQTSNPKAWEMLDRWIRADADYFNLRNEENVSPSQQIEALVNGAKAIAAASDDMENLQFILRPTELHNNLLRALIESRGLRLDRAERDIN